MVIQLFLGFFSSIFVGALVILGLLLPLFAIISLLRNDFKGSNDKVVWILVILFLPYFGSILYFLMGRPRRM